MEKKYKITAIIISLFIAFCPLLTTGFISYASNVPGGSGGAWDSIETHEDIVAAFKAYCQTTGLNTEHVPNIVNAIVKWDYSQLEKYAALANVDLNALNAHIWYSVQQNKPLKFYFDSTGVTSCQKIYAEIVSEYNLQENTSKTISTKYFEDSDGNSCYCYVVNVHKSSWTYTYHSLSDFHANILSGTYYRWTGLSFYNNNPQDVYTNVINWQGGSATYNLLVNKVENKQKVQLSPNSTSLNSYNPVECAYLNWGSYHYVDGCVCIIYDKELGRYYLGTFLNTNTDSSLEYENNKYIVLYENIRLTGLSPQDSDITYNQGEPVNHPQNKGMEVTTGDTTINNYITNNNTNITYNYDDNNEPPSSLTPLPPTPNYPTGGTQDPDGNFNWTMPDLDIDFHINSDISNIFPFSIPFDIIHFFDIFDSEPVTPEVDTTFEICNIEIPLQFDLHWLDDTAAYFRAFILAIYCFGLAIATRALFHIY